MKKAFTQIKLGFTLVELLIVISIIGILSSIGLVAFTSSQMRARDAQRKNDLKQIATALDLYYADHSSYPATLTWGTTLTDGKTTYFQILPKDPVSNLNYSYRTFTAASGGVAFQVFTHLENTQDPSCISGSCTSPIGIPGAASCGKVCNFAVTSSNTTSTE